MSWNRVWLGVVQRLRSFAMMGMFVAQDPTYDVKLLESVTSVIPHPRQLAWQRLEFTGFIHFGVNTFTGAEWGTGKESPDVFQPTELHCDQWAIEAKNAGMKLLMITAKHHDGFCLWPSAYTEHDVESSSWRDGKGDVLAELHAACDRHDLKMGLYLSPADLAEIEREGGLYGNGSEVRLSNIPSLDGGLPVDAPRFEFAVDDYNRYFLNQLYELITNYGPIHEVWFDGANPKPGTGQSYSYDAWYALIRSLAPEAVIAIKGPDVRWCGNEAGNTRPEEWSVIPLRGSADHWHWPDMQDEDLGSLRLVSSVLEEGGELHWYPSEVNTSIREGWFFRDEEQRVKTSEEILDIWYRSVGGNSVFLLNVPPDRRGQFSPRDVKVLREVGEVLKLTFSNNDATSANVHSSVPGVADQSPMHLVDSNSESYWMSSSGTKPCDLIFSWSEPQRFNRLVIQEPIERLSQRIARFSLDVLDGDQWREVFKGTTVGYKRICRFKTQTTSSLRIRILDSRAAPALCEVGVYREPVRLTLPEAVRDDEGVVRLSCPSTGATIRFTTDGSFPGLEAPIYLEPLPFSRGGKIRVRAYDDDGRGGPDMTFDFSKIEGDLPSSPSESQAKAPRAFVIENGCAR